jgi:hypothetical protein
MIIGKMRRTLSGNRLSLRSSIIGTKHPHLLRKCTVTILLIESVYGSLFVSGNVGLGSDDTDDAEEAQHLAKMLVPQDVQSFVLVCAGGYVGTKYKRRGVEGTNVHTPSISLFPYSLSLPPSFSLCPSRRRVGSAPLFF